MGENDVNPYLTGDAADCLAQFDEWCCKNTTGLLTYKISFTKRVIVMEQSFELQTGELQIPCKLSVPDDGEIRRVVLGVHGFSGSMEDEIQVALAEEMEFFSSATLRFDFPAHGINPSDELTLQACRETLMTVAREAKRRFPEVEDLCVFASGFGAYVVLVTLEELVELPGRIKLVVQTPGVMMHTTLLAMIKMSRETLWAMEYKITRTARPILVTYSFYEELAENLALVAHPIPMLILQGEQDSVIQMEHILHLKRLSEGSKLVILPGTSHRFLEEGAWDMVLDLTRDWFECEQVLLMDCE